MPPPAAKKPTRPLTCHVHPELKRLIEAAAAAQDVEANTYVSRVFAGLFARPDLAEPPRRKRGRPRRSYSQ